MICTVAYNSTAVLPVMLGPLPQTIPIVIANNLSEDREKLNQIVALRSSMTSFVESEQILGFGSACNKGAVAAYTEFFLFLNPDTAICPDTLQKHTDAAERRPDAPAYNPQILDDEGRVVLKRCSVFVDRSTWLSKREVTEDTVVPVFSGPAIFIRRFALEVLGGFKPAIFLFFDGKDFSLCLSRSQD